MEPFTLSTQNRYQWFWVVYLKARPLGQIETTTTPTEHLINLMRMRENDEQRRAADTAFKELCARFGPKLVRSCRRVVRIHGREQSDGDDLANMALQRFWMNRTFDVVKVKSGKVDGAIRLYLYRTAERLLFDLHESEQCASPYDGSEDVVETVEGYAQRKPEFASQEVIDLIIQAMDGLSWKHRVIFLTYLCHAKEGYKMPRALLKRLRARVELPQNTIQFYKKEASDRFKSFLATHHANESQEAAAEY